MRSSALMLAVVVAGLLAVSSALSIQGDDDVIIFVPHVNRNSLLCGFCGVCFDLLCVGFFVCIVLLSLQQPFFDGSKTAKAIEPVVEGL